MPTNTTPATSEAAEAIDHIAQHLGNAAGAISSKVTEIVHAYGPDAVSLIREAGRLAAFKDFGYFFAFTSLFILFFVLFMKTFNKMIKLAETQPGGLALETPRNTVGLVDLIMTKLVIFGGLSALCLIGLLVNFSLMSMWGIVTPDAYLIIKLLKI